MFNPSSAQGKTAAAPQEGLNKYPFLTTEPLHAAALEHFALPATATEWGSWAGAIKELRDAGATPAELTIAKHAFTRLYPQAICTLRALNAHWSALLEEGYGRKRRADNTPREPEGDSGKSFSEELAEEIARARAERARALQARPTNASDA